MIRQDTRFLEIVTPLDNKKIKLRSFSGHEEMSRLFRFEIEFSFDGEVSKDELIKKLIGQNISLRIDLSDGKRFFNGFASHVTAGYHEDLGTVYNLEMVPWLWFLTKTSDCRIFQNKKTPDIIKQIFDDLKFKDYKLELKQEHKEWEYCVQYRETDFNFVSRLMEQEGIFYFFKHEEGKHMLVLADDTSGYYDLPDKNVAFPLSHSTTGTHVDHITSWNRRIEFNTGGWAQTDYNFKTPSNNLMSIKGTTVGPPNAKDFEIYDYPGEFEQKDVGLRETQVRMEEEETVFDQVSGSSSCRTFSPGGKFTITGEHPSDSELNQTYVVTSIHHFANEPTEGQSGASEYTNSFNCVSHDVPFRPARITPKPLISGVQTAVVVGPKGEEIYTDEYGRVKVQFYWDREGKRDENSSIFIRCAQNIAGKKWGFMAVPRIGQEVVVDFLEGDPDRPLIVGSVYNAEQMPHYDPLEHSAKTIIKTNTTKGGDGFNELFFDDKKENERIFMHGQKDMDVRVLNDSRTRIMNDRHQIIGDPDEGKVGDQKEMVYQDKHLNVKRNQTEHIEGNMQLMIGNGEADDPGKLDVVVEKQMTEFIGEDGYDFHLKGERKELIEKSASLAIGGEEMKSVGADAHLQIDGNHNQKVAGSNSLDIGQNYEESAGIKHAVDAGQEIHLKAGMKVIIEAGVQVSLVGPGGFVDIGPAGVTIQGIMVKINSGGSAGSGSGASPEKPMMPESPREALKAAPVEPDQAHDEKTGYKSAPD